MLKSLFIKNFILISDLNLDFHTGFTAITGETGAGKSMILDALNVVLGRTSRANERTDKISKDKTNKDAKQENITKESFIRATFILPHDLILTEGWCVTAGHPIVIQRILAPTPKMTLNNQPLTLSLLKSINHLLLTMHSQHDHLLNESSHQIIVDDMAAHDPLFASTQDQCHRAYQHWHNIKQNLQTLEKSAHDATSFDKIRQDLGDLSLSPTLETELIQTLSQVAQASEITTQLYKIQQGLSSPKVWPSLLYGFIRRLESFEDVPALTPIIESFHNMALELADIMYTMENLELQLKTAATQADTLSARLHKLRDMMLKYHTTCEGLYDLYQKACDVPDYDHQRHVLQKALQEAYDQYCQHEETLYTLRQNAAQKLIQAMNDHMGDVQLEQCLFQVYIERAATHDHNGDVHIKPVDNGGHTVRFLVSMNKGQPLTPLSKTICGGEMSRLMLVLKLVLAQVKSLSCLIFDEIDTGVGGSVAMAMGRKLRLLGEQAQVFAITHSPQVAASANQQLKVMKHDDVNQTVTHITPLNENNRLEEIARMLSGLHITDEAKLAAQALMRSAV